VRTLLLALLLCAPLCAAPAPFAKSPKNHHKKDPPCPIPGGYGTYEMVDIVSWRFTIHGGGHYECLWFGVLWEGRWEVEEGFLKIYERPQGADHPYHFYKFQFSQFRRPSVDS
jgi:hypothetical protein